MPEVNATLPEKIEFAKMRAPKAIHVGRAGELVTIVFDEIVIGLGRKDALRLAEILEVTANDDLAS